MDIPNSQLVAAAKRLIALGCACFAISLLTSCEDRSPLELLSAQGIAASSASLLDATFKNQAHLVGLLTEAGVHPDKGRDVTTGQTALMIAARHGYAEAVERLTSRTGNFEITDSRGMTALSYSICNDQLGIAETLLSAGASADAVCHAKQSLLVTSVIRADAESLDLLLEHGAKRGLDDALLIAVTENKTDLAEMLIKNGANPNAGSDGEVACAQRRDAKWKRSLCGFADRSRR